MLLLNKELCFIYVSLSHFDRLQSVRLFNITTDNLEDHVKNFTSSLRLLSLTLSVARKFLFESIH
jgi:hypothetical protein